MQSVASHGLTDFSAVGTNAHFCQPALLYRLGWCKEIVASVEKRIPFQCEVRESRRFEKGLWCGWFGSL